MASPTRLAVQMYTLREHTKTPADIAATCKKLADQGWSAVQASALGPIEPAELKKILDDHGLQCVATHRGLDHLCDDPQRQIDEHAVLNCKYTAIGGFFPNPEDFTRANWTGFIDRYNRAAPAYAGSPLSIGYHNHSHEWAKVGQGLTDPTAMDLLAEGLDDNIWFEIDTYWVAHGGGDPVAWVDRFAGRIPCVHLKDLAIKPDKTQYMAEVGVGNLNWPAILSACDRVGVEWYIVEQDTCYRDPFDSLKTSLENLRAMGLS
jgi:sugar phosphate isomerase/epimerase